MAKVGRMVKESMVEELSRELGEQPNLFVTKISRLTASEADALRHTLHASRAKLLVAKRRLGIRVLDGLNVEGLSQLSEGSLGLVVSQDDVLQVAKQIVEFIKSHEAQLEMRGAVIEGQLLDRARVEALAKLPSKPQLLAMVIGTVESPIASVITTVERLIGDLIRGLDQLATKRGDDQAGGPAERGGAEVPRDADRAAGPSAAQAGDAPTPEPKP